MTIAIFAGAFVLVLSAHMAVAFRSNCIAIPRTHLFQSTCQNGGTTNFMCNDPCREADYHVMATTVPTPLCHLSIQSFVCALTFFVVTSTSVSVPESFAFDNAVKVVEMPKTRGPAPNNLGVGDKSKLRTCMKQSPNCFSTSSLIDLNGDSDDLSDSTSNWGDGDIQKISPWKYTKGGADDAFLIIGKVLSQYEPGHDNIDGGGFKIIKADARKRYYYVQFESLKRGYIDDVEFLVNDDSTVQVVSSSRIGYLDFQVNAKRLNYIASKLKEFGFEAAAITPETHPVYFESNAEWVRPDLGLGKKKY